MLSSVPLLSVDMHIVGKLLQTGLKIQYRAQFVGKSLQISDSKVRII